jgi:hypothetical protein
MTFINSRYTFCLISLLIVTIGCEHEIDPPCSASAKELDSLKEKISAEEHRKSMCRCIYTAFFRPWYEADSIDCMDSYLKNQIGMYYSIVEQNAKNTKIAVVCGSFSDTLSFSYFECCRQLSIIPDGSEISVTSNIPLPSIDYLELKRYINHEVWKHIFSIRPDSTEVYIPILPNTFTKTSIIEYVFIGQNVLYDIKHLEHASEDICKLGDQILIFFEKAALHETFEISKVDITVKYYENDEVEPWREWKLYLNE